MKKINSLRIKYLSNFKQTKVYYDYSGLDLESIKIKGKIESFFDLSIETYKAIEKVKERYITLNNLFFDSQLIINKKYFYNKEKLECFNYMRVGYNYNGINKFRDFEFKRNVFRDILNYLEEQIFFLNKILSRYENKSSDVLLTSNCAGFFIHEIFGHMLENDSNSNFLGSLLSLDKRVNIYDNPFLSESLDYGNFDDVGIKYKKKQLVTGGRVTGRITTRCGDNVTDKKLCRMTNIELVYDFDDLEQDCHIPALTIDQILNGSVDTNSGDFVLNAISGFDDKHKYKNLIICGNAYDAAKEMHIKKEKTMLSIGTCIKEREAIIVGMKSPAIILKNVWVMQV